MVAFDMVLTNPHTETRMGLLWRYICLTICQQSGNRSLNGKFFFFSIGCKGHGLLAKEANSEKQLSHNICNTLRPIQVDPHTIGISTATEEFKRLQLEIIWGVSLVWRLWRMTWYMVVVTHWKRPWLTIKRTRHSSWREQVEFRWNSTISVH